MYRTHNCGQLSENNINEHVVLCGWVHIIRDKGNIIWIDLRDRYGITQLVISEELNNLDKLKSIAHSLGKEFVIQASGKVIKRFSPNPNIPTGMIEIEVDDIKIINKSLLPPFSITDSITDNDANEDIRFRYRYLDLRRSSIQKNIILRHKIIQSTRKFFNEHGFLDIDTPTLIKSTPGGARDFLVPSRINMNQFYALPQSPQLLKQLLMIAGYDKYYQIAKCYRDEDFRADRQPEFTQIDCEMSFVNQEDVMSTFELFIKTLFKDILDIDLGTIPRMTYQEAMNKYGSDKPNMCFEMQISDLSNVYKLFDSEYIGGLCVKNKSDISRKQLDELSELVKIWNKSYRLIWIKNNTNNISSSISSVCNQNIIEKYISTMQAQNGDLILMLCGNKEETQDLLGKLRLHLGNKFDLINKDVFKVTWIIDFPLFEYDKDKEQYIARHHQFTNVNESDLHYLDTGELDKVRAQAYDFVINGYEVGGGSIRIHDPEFQNKIFKILKMDEKSIEDNFGFLVEALSYGAPPHGGIAFGLERLCMILGKENSIKPFIAFPKNNSGKDLMIGAPSFVNSDQLKELNLNIKKN